MKKIICLLSISLVALDAASAPQNAEEEAAQLAAAIAASKIMAQEEVQLAKALEESKRSVEAEEEKRASAEAARAVKSETDFWGLQLVKGGVHKCVDRKFFGQYGERVGSGVGEYGTKVFCDNVGQMHRNGHLWPNKYMQVLFQYGLLNFFVGEALLISPVNLKGECEDKAFKGFSFRVQAAPFLKCRNGPAYIEGVRTKVLPIMRAFVEGLYHNNALMHVGADYQIQKVRLEKIGKKASSLGKSAEDNRADLLQDYCYTFVRCAAEALFNMAKSAKDSETEVDLNQIRDYFSRYLITLKDIPMETLTVLKTCDLGAEDERFVPRILKELADSGVNQGEQAWGLF